MSRYVIGPDVAVRLARERTVPADGHQILAPSLIRSQVLSLLYLAVRQGELTRRDAGHCLDHIRGLRLRLLGDRVRYGCTVIMTTHILEVAERMADRIGVIASGRLVAEGTLAELRQQSGKNDTSLEDMFIALVDVEAAAA